MRLLKSKLFKEHLIQSTPLRIILIFVLFTLIVAIIRFLVKIILVTTDINSEFKNSIEISIIALVTITIYNVFFKKLEKRNVMEIKFENFQTNLVFGLVIGGLLQTVTMATVHYFSEYKVIRLNPVSFILLPLLTILSTSIVQEILFRGILFRLTEKKWGSTIALISTSLIFGLLQLANSNCSVFNALSKAIQAGFLLGVAFMFTRNLWFPIMINFAWNFFQSAIFGIRVTGNEIHNAWINAYINGPIYITGGDLGPEASIQANIFCLIIAFILLIINQEKIIQKEKNTNLFNY